MYAAALQAQAKVPKKRGVRESVARSAAVSHVPGPGLDRLGRLKASLPPGGAGLWPVAERGASDCRGVEAHSQLAPVCRRDHGASRNFQFFFLSDA